MDDVDDGSAALTEFREAAIAWAAGGRGQPLVDAAALALSAGVDSPSLRSLAGAPHRTADAEATELAPAVFAELDLDVEERLSPAAYVELARQLARGFLAGSVSPRDLTRSVWSLSVAAGHPSELLEWSGLDDWYGMVRDGTVRGSADDIDAQVVAAARELVGHGPGDPVPIEGLVVPPAPKHQRGLRGWIARAFRRRAPSLRDGRN